MCDCVGSFTTEIDMQEDIFQGRDPKRVAEYEEAMSRILPNILRYACIFVVWSYVLHLV